MIFLIMIVEKTVLRSTEWQNVHLFRCLQHALAYTSLFSQTIKPVFFHFRNAVSTKFNLVELGWNDRLEIRDNLNLVEILNSKSLIFSTWLKISTQNHPKSQPSSPPDENVREVMCRLNYKRVERIFVWTLWIKIRFSFCLS